MHSAHRCCTASVQDWRSPEERYGGNYTNVNVCDKDRTIGYACCVFVLPQLKFIHTTRLPCGRTEACEPAFRHEVLSLSHSPTALLVFSPTTLLPPSPLLLPLPFPVYPLPFPSTFPPFSTPYCSSFCSSGPLATEWLEQY